MRIADRPAAGRQPWQTPSAPQLVPGDALRELGPATRNLKNYQSTEKSGLTKIETTPEYDEYFELHFLSRKRFSFTRRDSPTTL